MTPAVPPGWHARSHQEAFETFQSSPVDGLAEEVAAERLSVHGPNRIEVRLGRGAVLRFALQFHQPLIYILLVSGAIAAFLHEWADAGVIFGVVLVNALIGFIQEGRAEDALAALARSVASEVTVLRAGQRRRLSAAELVLGDVVWLAAGDKVPADLRLFDTRALQITEASLTGESTAVGKGTEPVPADSGLAERTCMAFAGTLVVVGQAAGLVVATGRGTETGRIADMLEQADTLATPLTRAMTRFSSALLVLILALAALGFVVGSLRGEPWLDMLMAAVALAVGAIPEGLPAAVTVTLAIGVARMARRRAIIRRLPAVETLGSTTVICSDKTGTLTENQMTVRAALAGGQRYDFGGDGYAPRGAVSVGGVELAEPPVALRQLLVAGVLCNDAGLREEDGSWQITGDPTEAALLVAARKAGLDEDGLRAGMPRLDEIAFDSVRQFMASLHRIDSGGAVMLKGAPEVVLRRCRSMLDGDGRVVPLDAQAIDEVARGLAAEGLRVLAFARLPIEEETLDEAALADGLCFLGLQAMLDPPRQAAIGAIRACHRAGITVKMITGDHAVTALAIARQLGLVEDGGKVLSGRELARLDADGLRRAVRDVHVFARVEPEQKLRLVQALQANGEVVAMTGDGVNDAPALKAADIGVAMGAGGTEVAKEAAAMVLTDDNFASIEAAVEEGRGVYDNLVKFIVWTLPTNFGEGLVILFAVLAGVTLPITPLQILWINMTTAVLLGLPLAFEPIQEDVMARAPRSPGSPILDLTLVRRIVLVGILLLVAAFGLFARWRGLGASLDEARTIAVNVFVAGEIAYLFNCRNLRGPVWRCGWFSNPWFWWGIGATLLLQAAFTWGEAMNRVFASAPIPARAWGEILLAAIMIALIVGGEKLLCRGTGRKEGG
ncbi:HAD-IC family P-type ATPase [Zoogloea sp. LCSB751]|uniref:HAD-IC family P-type ATPase n=1 Tax=Zoogloea sp. LCSB751 TaxID=1965277 RepID=UPI0009A4D5FB|nr:HAD-IC family P-type ATPase [Zoogloea sp. LCSB751]